MKTVFPSKKGLELIIPLVLVFTFIGYQAYKEPKIVGIIIILLIIGFFVHLFVSTYYVVDGDRLYIKCSIFYNVSIGVNSILKISETNNPMSSPATSLDRLEIVYKKGEFSNSILISPKDKKGLIDLLLKQNPNIEVRYKTS